MSRPRGFFLACYLQYRFFSSMFKVNCLTPIIKIPSEGSLHHGSAAVFVLKTSRDYQTRPPRPVLQQQTQFRLCNLGHRASLESNRTSMCALRCSTMRQRQFCRRSPLPEPTNIPHNRVFIKMSYSCLEYGKKRLIKIY